MSPSARIAAVVAAVALAAPAAGAHAAPAPTSPVQLAATNGSSSISLTWSQPSGGSRAVAFRVYEGGVVVARNTTTYASIRGLGFSSTHTYTVTAVDADGHESPPSAPVTRQVWVGGAAPQCRDMLPAR